MSWTIYFLSIADNFGGPGVGIPMTLLGLAGLGVTGGAVSGLGSKDAETRAEAERFRPWGRGLLLLAATLFVFMRVVPTTEQVRAAIGLAKDLNGQR